MGEPRREFQAAGFAGTGVAQAGQKEMGQESTAGAK